MSLNEKNLTPAEQLILKELNTRALLIIKAENVLKTAKVPIDPNILYDLSDDDLIGLCETWDLENQKELRDKHMNNETKKPK
jgi:hypothetical protein